MGEPGSSLENILRDAKAMGLEIPAKSFSNKRRPMLRTIVLGLEPF